MSGMERVWLGWCDPVLDRAARWICDHAAIEGDLDLSDTLLVVPVSQAGRWLEGMLIDLCEERGMLLTPPRIVTLARIAEALAPAAIATPESRTAAWRQAMQDSGDPFQNAGDPWVWASALRRTSEALQSQRLRFEDVLTHSHTLEPEDRERLEVCVAMERRYREILVEAGEADLLMRIAAGSLARFARTLLVAPTELGALGRGVLEQCSQRIVSLVAAPEEHADRFDAFGVPIPSAWSDAELPISSGSVRFADDPADQAHAAWECVAASDGPLAVRDVVLGVMDSASASAVTRIAASQGVRTRDAGGRALAETPVCRLLDLLAAYLRHRTMPTLLELCRHPDMEDAIGGERWLSRLDAYASRTQLVQLPSDTKRWPAPRTHELPVFDHVLPRLHDLIAPCLAPDGQAPLGGHVGRVIAACARIYADRQLREDNEGDRSVRVGLEAMRTCAEGLARSQVRCRIDEAITLMATAVGEGAVPPPQDDGAVQLLGWLELATDPAPVCVVCDVCESRLPTPVGADPFIPATLRARLGLSTDASRAGRDAYLMALIASCKQRAFFVAPARTAEGDPLPPSRLLFRADDRSVLERLERACAEGRDPLRTVHLAGTPTPITRTSGFEPMPVVGGDQPERWSVTSFRGYLASPYAYYVQQVLKRRETRAYAGEMDAAAFGDLVHEALRRYGDDIQASTLTDPDEIRAAMTTHLHEAAIAFHGHDPSRAVWIQIEQALWRLDAFARAQSAWARKGWQIKETEWAPQDGVTFEIPGGDPVTLTGTIDRIDRNAETGAHAIIDYKTGARAQTPEKAHRVKDQWRDLQLPLYRHLAQSLGVGSEPVLAYGLIPPDPSSMGIVAADWSASDLDDAESCARWVVDRVRAHAFADLGDRPVRAGVLGALGGFGLIETSERSAGDGEGGA
ncbi:MAG: PD-(D/E)XK nuclease family protein [Phycisphaerales bacterium]